MRIGILTTSYPRYDKDYAGNFVYALNREFARHGIYTDTIVPFLDTYTAPVSIGGTLVSVYHNDVNDHLGLSKPILQSDRSLSSLLELQRLRHVSRNQSKASTLAKNWMHALHLSLRQMRAVANMTNQWQALLCHWLLPSSLSAIAMAPKTPRILIGHGSDIHLLGRMPKIIRSQILSVLFDAQCKTIPIFVSEQLRELLADIAPNRLKPQIRAAHIIPMGFDEPDAVSARRSLIYPSLSRGALRRSRAELVDFGHYSQPVEAEPDQLKQRKKGRSIGMSQANAATILRVGYIGRLIPSKGVDRLLDAVRILVSLPNSSGYQIHCHIIGNGPLRSCLEQQARRLESDRSDITYVFHGSVIGRDKWELLSDLDVVVLPFQRTITGAFDGAPTTPLEVLSVGLPLICSDLVLNDAPDEVLIRIESGSTGAIVDALSKFVSDPQRYKDLSGSRKTWVEKRSWRYRGQQFAELIRELVP